MRRPRSGCSIARDLHDSAGHAINVILVHAGAGRLQVERDPAAAREAFQTIEDVARETVGEIDQMVGALRERAAGVAGGGGAARRRGARRAGGAPPRRRPGRDRDGRGDRAPAAAGVDRSAYRILQEALTNAARHGDGSARVDSALGADALELTVANPVGRRPARAATREGHGVVGMRERATLLGGSLEAGARNGSFEVHARLPLAGRAP